MTRSFETFSLIPSDLLKFVREHSSFYNGAFSHLPLSTILSDLPITDVEAYWSSSTASAASVLTAPFTDGVVMRSGGSTAEPKIVYITRDELRRICQINAVAMSTSTGLVPGDLIANLSHMGGMYGGFMFNNTTFMELPVDNVHLPISGQQPLDVIADTVDKFKATVILSNVYTPTRLAEWLKSQRRNLQSVRLVLYSGETFFKDVRPLWNEAFPNAIIAPYLYGSVECGPIGLPAHPPRPTGDDDINPLYKVVQPAVHMEIVDSEGRPIIDAEVKGNVIITHLIKRLQPMIRYPVGDIAAWEDYEQKTFRLYGRDSVALKINTTLLDLPLLKSLIGKHISQDAAAKFQSVVRRVKGKNVLVFRVAIPPPNNAALIRDALEENIALVSQSWVWNRTQGLIAPLEVEYVEMSKLVLNHGSGKLKHFVEERF
ncbi:AMP-dependent synthetase/ligase [Xylona heveae TC161]|uniref:AMP-dependent synthetase/ligase n=1 Tax=Xylona heveae (strain CBS 132557 / TC161) TaxID=1328760 RepID=A0A164Z8A5_XYLHT|nr:AMP-dependent synthetase/ligase [Xylona heveae TC161]KZF18809.1 AMP-dependent synthetase/ligase [Xylona heveae TC161]